MSPIAIPWARPDYWGREKEYVLDSLESTWISGGEYVNRLERDLSKYLSCRHALAAANGTASLHLAYLALGIGAGDEIIVPGFAFLAAANIALHVGAKPVFAEVDADTWCVTAEAIEACMSARTRAIVPVHTYGNVCAMDEIMALARRRGIPVIEDAAEAFGSRYQGRLAGTFADVGSFSFQATKTITTGEGGLVTTDDDELASRMALYRSHGMLRKRFYWHELPGHNFRLTNMQAAIGCAQFEHIERIVAARKRLHAQYTKRLQAFAGVTAQFFPAEVDAVLWAFAVKLDPSAFPQGRDAVIGQMAEGGVETRPGFYPPSAMEFYRSEPLPVCEDIARNVLSLPSYPTITDQQLDYICARLYALRR